MRILPVLALVTVVLVSLLVSNSFALRQMAGVPEVAVYPGGSEEFTWGLVSDDAEHETTVNIRTEGDGAEFLAYPESVVLKPGATEYVTILVQVPEDHYQMTDTSSYSPSLFATESGKEGGAVVINVSMEKR